MTMRTSKCISSTAAALHRIFIAPIEQQSQLQLPRSSLLQSRWPSSTQPRNALLSQSHQRRTYIVTSTAPVAKTSKRALRNEEIKSYMIRLVTEDGKLSDPRVTSSILSTLDPMREMLTMVAEAQPSEDGALSFPICKIINKKEHFDNERMRKKAAKENKDPSKTSKTLELNWAIEGGDLNHRLERLREWLGKGWRVEVVLAKKRKGRVTGKEEREELLKRVKEVLVDVGGRENRPMEGNVEKGVVTIHAEGKVKKEGK